MKNKLALMILGITLAGQGFAEVTEKTTQIGDNNPKVASVDRKQNKLKKLNAELAKLQAKVADPSTPAGKKDKLNARIAKIQDHIAKLNEKLKAAEKAE